MADLSKSETQVLVHHLAHLVVVEADPTRVSDKVDFKMISILLIRAAELIEEWECEQ
jgi:hypothetical protein